MEIQSYSIMPKEARSNDYDLGSVFDILEMDDPCQDSDHSADYLSMFGQQPTDEIVEQHREELSGYPEQWQSFNDGQLLKRPFTYQKTFDVGMHSPEYNEVVWSLTREMSESQRNGLSVKRVQRVQNPFRWRRYKSMRDEMDMKGFANEMTLIHGTSAEAAQKICESGFNRSFCGKNGTCFGEGVYFSRHFTYSAHPKYSKPGSDGLQQVFICKVLVGVTGQGAAGMKEPPLLSSNERCDSSCDPAKNIFVTYHDDQSYPEYLVSFNYDVQQLLQNHNIAMRPSLISLPQAVKFPYAPFLTPIRQLSQLQAASNQSDYIPATTFSGSVPGFVFKVGTKGLGFYRDAPVSGYAHHVSSLLRLLPVHKQIPLKRWTLSPSDLPSFKETLSSIASGEAIFWYNSAKSASFLSKDTVQYMLDSKTPAGGSDVAGSWQPLPWVEEDIVGRDFNKQTMASGGIFGTGLVGAVAQDITYWVMKVDAGPPRFESLIPAAASDVQHKFDSRTLPVTRRPGRLPGDSADDCAAAVSCVQRAGRSRKRRRDSVEEGL